MAEMLEARTDEFVGLLDSRDAASEVQTSVDRLLHYAGWSDKFQQLLGTVNPVAAPYFNFSVPEPMGVVGIAAGGDGLLGLISLLAPAIVGGNTCVLVAADSAPIVACEFAEVVATSDVPGGVVNILTGLQSETLPHLAKHMDVNALVVAGAATPGLVDDATANLKRLRFYADSDQGLSWIADLQETKTVWHPVGI
jgi:acyl-CoA reductase-like NAD-dependent aldehyde dehydrogenase